MAGLTRATVVKKVKKHGKKKFVRVSNKKAVKNGRYQEKEVPVSNAVVKVMSVKKVKPLVEELICGESELGFDENDEYIETDEDLTEYADVLAVGD
jgi:hypothetical protein